MENLTKENFFNELQSKYPKGMKHFCDWIDEYKKEVNWNALFSSNENTMQLHSSKYKFHDIPYEMQVGILLKYIDETIEYPTPISVEVIKAAFIEQMELDTISLEMFKTNYSDETPFGKSVVRRALRMRRLLPKEEVTK